MDAFNVRRLLSVLPFLLAPQLGHAHGAFGWVMDNPKTAWCCGKQDCRDLRPGEAKWTPSGWQVNGWAVPAANVYESAKAHGDHMSACFHMDGARMTNRPRCLFRVPARF